MMEDMDKKLDQLLEQMPKPQYDLDGWMEEDETAEFDRIVSECRRRPTIHRWLAAAACLLLIIGIGAMLMPKGQTDELLVAEKSICGGGPHVNKTEQIMTEAPVVANVKTEDVAGVSRERTVAKAKPRRVTAKKVVAQQPTESMEPVAIEEPAVAEVLTERDIPITRPENYKYTPEEIALLKKQANEAYLKWVELELEISRYTLEQTAQK